MQTSWRLAAQKQDAYCGLHALHSLIVVVCMYHSDNATTSIGTSVHSFSPPSAPQLDNPAVFPQRYGAAFPRDFLNTVKTILKRLFRVYAHIYHSHFKYAVAWYTEKGCAFWVARNFAQRREYILRIH